MSDRQINAAAAQAIRAVDVEAFASVLVQRIQGFLLLDCRLLDADGAARYLGMTTSALRHKIERGLIPTVRMDGKLRFDRLELDRWIDTAKREGV
jgi:excisionase family DNA binding protein